MHRKYFVCWQEEHRFYEFTINYISERELLIKKKDFIAVHLSHVVTRRKIVLKMIM